MRQVYVIQTPGESGADAVKSGSTKLQYIAAAIAGLMAFNAGVVRGWTSPAIPHLMAPDTPLHITQLEDSWIVSITPIAAVFGPAVGGFLADRLGRKASTLASALPAFVSWVTLAAAPSIPAIYFARAAAGVASGWAFTVVPMYINEISETKIRGVLGSFFNISVNLGLCYVYAVGPPVSYFWLSVACAPIPILLVLLMSWMPETPYYHLLKNNEEAARESLRLLRGFTTADPVEAELKEMMNVVKSKTTDQTGVFRDLFLTKANGKGMFIVLSLTVLQQCSGLTVITYYAQMVFDKAGGLLSPAVAALVAGLVMLAGGCVTPLLVERLGRRVLLLSSSLGMALGQGVMGLCFYLERNNIDIPALSILPLLSAMVYNFTYSYGVGALFRLVLCEMLTPRVLGLASSIAGTVSWFSAFLVARFYHDMAHLLGDDVTFWIYTGCCVLTTVMVFCLFPETKGKTLAEIQAALSR